jgi:hypothetical protein
MPQGYQACPLYAPADAAVRLCLVLRARADPVAGWFVPVRETFDSRVFLGCLTDQRGTVLQWVEIALQTPDFAIDGPESVRQHWNNQLLDMRWKNNIKVISASAPESIISGTWETEHPIPMFLDPVKRKLCPLVDSDSGHTWTLCCDDQLLMENKLPQFSTNLFRYLHIKSGDGQNLFLAVQDDAPQTHCVQLLRDALAAQGWLAWNAGGYLMQVGTFSSLSSEAFLDVLGGSSYDGLPIGKVPADFDRIGAILRDTGEMASAGTVFLGRHGRRGRIVESLHLKLKFLADAVQQTQAMIRSLQRPLLNLQCASFQISLANPAVALPFLWTAQTRLIDPGDAARLTFSDAQAAVFTRGVKISPGVYQPAVEGRDMATDKAILRLRTVTIESDGSCWIEGTLSNLEAVTPRSDDLICLRVGLSGQRLLLAGSAEKDSALAAGEYRFQSMRQPVAPALAESLKAAQGAALQPIWMQCVPRMDTAYDLYALAVMALRTLVVHAGNPLPVAVDELHSLARQIAGEYSADKPLSVRITDLFLRDPRWNKTLGPHHVFHAADAQENAGDLIPAALWADILALMVKMLPAIGPDSLCRTYGTMPAAAMANVFDPVVAKLDRLLIQTRSLIVIDWQVNREVHSVIRRFQMGM